MTLARYVVQRKRSTACAVVEWHLDHCPVCKAAVSVRDVIDTARSINERRFEVIRPSVMGPVLGGHA